MHSRRNQQAVEELESAVRRMPLTVLTFPVIISTCCHCRKQRSISVSPGLAITDMRHKSFAGTPQISCLSACRRYLTASTCLILSWPAPFTTLVEIGVASGRKRNAITLVRNIAHTGEITGNMCCELGLLQVAHNEIQERFKINEVMSMYCFAPRCTMYIKPLAIDIGGVACGPAQNAANNPMHWITTPCFANASHNVQYSRITYSRRNLL